MQTLIEFLSANPWLNLLFLILAVGSIVVSVGLFFKSRKEKILVYATTSFNLIHNSVVKVPGLSIQFEGNDIDTLTLTKIAYWNKGKDTINSNDIAPSDRVRIVPDEDVTILNAVVSFKTRDANNFCLEKIQNSLFVNFDYIDFNQGLIIDVYHTGQDSSDLILNGTVKGGRDLHPGDIPKDYLLNKIVDPILNRFPWTQNKVLDFFFFVIFVLIILVPFIIVLPIDKIHKLMNRLPAEFDLSTKT